MPYLNFNSAKPIVKLLIILMSVITIGIIVFFTGVLIGRVIFWMSLDQVNNVLYGRYELLTNWQLKYFQIIQTLGFFVIPGFFLHWLFSTPTKQYFSIKFELKPVHIFLIIAVFILGTPLINWIVTINQKITFPEYMSNIETKLRHAEDSYTQLTARLISVQNFGYYLFNILMIAVLPAIGEELIFRGVIQKLLINVSKNIHLSIIITAILFSAVHGQFFGFIARFLLGVFLGYLMVWGKTVWLPVFAHFINNALAVTFYYLYSKNLLNSAPDSIGANSFYAVVASLAITIVLIYYIKKTSAKAAQISTQDSI